jgi:hypothetical protein
MTSIPLRATSYALLFAFALTPFQIAAAQTAKPPARKPPTAGTIKPTPAAAATPTPAVAPTCICPPLAPMRVQPYTAKQELTHVQTLTDGTNIKTVEEISLARDAQGRTRRESVGTQNGDAVHSFQIFDPITQIRYTWNVGGNYPQVVTVYHQRPNPQPVVAQTPVQRYYPYTSESLPPQTIGGLYVTGIHSTRTIPAGYEGNDHDLVTTTESWYAPSVGVQMRTITDDPRSGKTTIETTDLQQSDPDPTLFQPPAGYTLKDANP